MGRYEDPIEVERTEPGRASGEQPQASRRWAIASAEEAGVRALLRAFDGLRAGVCILDRDGCYVALNAVAEQIFRRPAADLVGRHYLDDDPAAAGGDFDRAFCGVRADGEARAVVRGRYAIEIADGDAWIVALWRETHASPNLDVTRTQPIEARPGDDRHHAQIARLLEAEREARAAAEEANRAKDAFLATVSHELRTPLSSMLGWARMLRSGTLRPDRAAHALAVIERNALVQAQIVEDLLDVSRIVTGRLRLEVEEVDLAPILDEAVDAVCPALEAKRIRFEQRLDAKVGPVLGDPARLRQVVWNLLANAVKFTPAEGRIELSLERLGAEIAITVKDSGPGIPAALRPRLFARFQQADMSTTRLHGGLGLGLAITRHLVELHGGAISLAEDEGSAGATFVVRLPIAPGRPRLSFVARPRRTSVRPLQAPPELFGVRVLVIDDQPDIRDLVASILAACGARITVAESASEARDHVLYARPDVIVCDIAMPHEDGYAFIGWLRALPREVGGLLPCGALTAYASAEDRRRILDAGYNLHLPKPVEPEELVQATLSLSRMARAIG